MSPLSFLGDCLGLVWMAIWCPVYFCEAFMRERQEFSPLSGRWVKKSRVECSPTPLPTRRPRKLTLRGSSKPAPKDKNETKPAFFKLPLETRQKIYEYVLVDGKPLIHINQSFKKLVYRRCPKQLRGQTCKNNTACFHGTLPALWGYYTGDDPNTYTRSCGGILPLLTSCRQIYSESVEMVYKLHVFNFDGFEAFEYFIKGIIRERLNNIRSLEIHGIILPPLYSTSMSPNDFKTWQYAWSTVATMKGLSNLTAIIEPGDRLPHYDAEEQAIIFAPLKQIRQVLNYEICLNWEKRSYDFDPECGPYRITRPIPPNT